MFQEIIFYRTAGGRNPVKEFLDSLSAREAQKATWTLSLIEDLEVVPGQYLRKMTGTENLWEVRIKTGANIIRILGFLDENKLFVLSHAFWKKTRKTPREAIALAAERKRDYFRRRGK